MKDLGRYKTEVEQLAVRQKIAFLECLGKGIEVVVLCRVIPKQNAKYITLQPIDFEVKLEAIKEKRDLLRRITTCSLCLVVAIDPKFILTDDGWLAMKVRNAQYEALDLAKAEKREAQRRKRKNTKGTLLNVNLKPSN